MIEDDIVNITKLSGAKIYDEEYYKKMIKAQVDAGQFKFIENENKPIGFFGWLTKQTSDGLCIFVNNFVLLDKHKNKFNFCSLRKFFKEKYGKIYKCEWHNQKKDKQIEFILQRGY